MEENKIETTRQSSIHQKGFDMMNGNRYSFGAPNEYGKIKVGLKTLDDAILTYGDLTDKSLQINKGMVLKALREKDLSALRIISEYFYNTSGIYARFCDYFAKMYRYDWYIIPEILDENVDEKVILKDYIKFLHYLDNSYIKKLCGRIALKVLKYGCYYGYLVKGSNRVTIQELPVAYCRSRYSVNDMPVVEFNMAYFDEKFPDTAYRLKVLNLFPEEFKIGYMKYKQGKLPQDDVRENADHMWGSERVSINTSKSGWFMLEPELGFKLNINDNDIPFFANTIPTILDLDMAQDLDRRKQMQQLLKIIVQKLPLDKNGDLIFDIDEAADIHNNAVEMLQRCIGVDVMTTFADVESINTSDKNTTATQDDLEKMERQVYNAGGISRNLFNTDGNLALSMSILNDESSIRDLLLQFEILFDRIVTGKNSVKKKYNFSFYMLETTQYNYKELAKMYKEQATNGQSKLLVQIALGQPQSAILNTVYFENEVLHLPDIMIPPLQSSVMSDPKKLASSGQSQNNQSSSQNKQSSSESGQAGRPEKPDSEKSEKTIKNKESMS